MRIALIAVCACLSLSALWAVGEQHRHNCAREGQSSCSVLPWDNGASQAYTVSEPVVTATPTPESLGDPWDGVK